MTLQRINALSTALVMIIAETALKSLVAVAVHDTLSDTVDIVVIGKFVQRLYTIYSENKNHHK